MFCFQGFVDLCAAVLVSILQEIMYDSIRAINQRFPDWLGKNRDKLPRSEYENYGKMYQTFQQMQLVYETDGANFGKLASLMQQLQEFGMPPAAIIKDVAPGLELTPDGTPILPNAVPGMPSLPVGGAPGDGVPACSVM
jgi:Pex19 protein family